MTRIALLFVLAVSLVVAGIVLFRIQTSPTREAQQTSERLEAMESIPRETVPETPIEDLGEGVSGMTDVPSDTTMQDVGSTAPSIEPGDHSHSEDGSSSTTTTTTTVPSTVATTETSKGPLVMTATILYPEGLVSGEGYRFGISCLDTEEDEDGNPPVKCDINAQGNTSIAAFEYFGHGMPYLYSEAVEGGHDHAWWVAGDREAYRCAYGFMLDRHPNPFGMLDEPRSYELIARATIVRPFGQSYGRVTDGHMAEAQRYYNGTAYTGGTNEISDENCQETALDDFDYDGYEPQGPDRIRVGLFRADGEIGDIRDFTQIAPLVPGHFEFISFEKGRVTIAFILGATNKVSHVFYYDSLNSGRIAVEVNGKLAQ